MPKFHSVTKTIAFLLTINVFLYNHFAKASDIDDVSAIDESSVSSTFNQEEDVLVDVPEVLSDKDTKAYKKIYEYQKYASWDKADDLIDNLENKALLGYVLYERYMHPKYNSSFSELKTWLEKYSDYKNADKIYKLAVRKGGKKNSYQLQKPIKKKVLRNYSGDYISYGQLITSGYYNLSSSNRKYVKKQIRRFKRALRNGWTKNAKNIIRDPATKKLLTNRDWHSLSAKLSFSYFLDNMDARSIKWAKDPADKYNIPIANWTLGLVYWRKRNYEKSRYYFEKLSNTSNLSKWLISSGAYWAYRANLRCDNPKNGKIYLEKAARYPRTFYGIIALKTLGKDIEINGNDITLTLNNAKELLSWQGGYRALALIQIGELNSAHGELNTLLSFSETSESLKEAIVALAEDTGMPNLSLNISNHTMDDEGKAYDSASYPFIPWEPEGGWSVDKALISALIRQESQFKTNAKSYAGASGLMQIMPATASFVSGKRSLRWNTDPLYEPSFNLHLGQAYLDHLLDSRNIEGNLFYLLTAYNAGPGNLNRWKRRVRIKDDPLFFIESIPARETRIYIEKVLANFWIYRHRMNQDTPSLARLVEERWPVYISLDKPIGYASK